MRDVIVFILAGGKGERLYPLTRDRAKPAVPFGGVYRVIDFTLSNCINSGMRKIHVLTQYKSISLHRHLRMGWSIFESEIGEYIDVIPAQQRVGSDWYKGTADAIYQNIYSIEQENPDEVLILAGDHIYKMNYYKMIDFHREHNADLTVGVVEIDRNAAVQFGVVDIDKNENIRGFKEKPADYKNNQNKSDKVYASMGIYLFNTDVLEQELGEDAAKDTHHDFGRNIIPQMIDKKRKICAYNLKNDVNQPQYWRDIGSIDAYYEANMDLVQVSPVFNLYDRSWPIRTYHEQFPPVKTVFSGAEDASRKGEVLDSLISDGCIVSGGRVERSILSPNVRINSFSEVYDSILMEGVNVSRYAKIKRAIIDKDVNIPQGAVIGYDVEEDRKKFFVSESGIVVVAKRTKIGGEQSQNNK